MDIRLGNEFSIIEDTPTGAIGPESEVSYKKIKSDTYILLSNQLVLTTTVEYFDLPDDLTAFAEGRGSLGRMGLFIQHAGWVAPGFKGEITLELYNANRCAIEMKAGPRVGQLVFAKMDQKASTLITGSAKAKPEPPAAECFWIGK